MAFDADAVLAAHRAWSFRLGGRTFLARHVSAPTVTEYELRNQEALEFAKTHPRRAVIAQVRALRWLLRRAFPWRVSYLLRGDPVDLLIGLPPAARVDVLKDFFACLRGQTTDPTATTLPLTKTRGTRSPAPTPRRNR